MKMKKRIIIAAVMLGCVAVAAIAVMARGNAGVVRIPDVTTRWNHTFKDRVHTFLSGELAISVTGEIDGNAVLRTSNGDIQISSGRVDKIMLAAEYWAPTCEMNYEPVNVRRGDLTVRVGLGSKAGWARYPLMETEPANYVGGWTTWYPDRKHMFSRGFFFRGQKKGTWTYWDEEGNVLKTEEWQDGKLIQTKTANQASDAIGAEAAPQHQR